LAKSGNPEVYFHEKHLHQKRRDCDMDFSGFSGWMDALIKGLEGQQPDLPVDKPLSQINDIAASLLKAMGYHILRRLKRAYIYLRYHYNEPIKDPLPLVISGGVACNDFITSMIRQYFSSLDNDPDLDQGEGPSDIIVPPKKLCTDNAIMIAWNALLKMRLNNGILTTDDEIEALDIQSKAPLGIDIRPDIVSKNIKVKLSRIQ